MDVEMYRQITSDQCFIKQVFPYNMVDGRWITDRDVLSLQFRKLEAPEVSSNISALSLFPFEGLSMLASSIESMPSNRRHTVPSGG
jgi:hypothetical protein